MLGVDAALVFSGWLNEASVIALGLFITATVVGLMTLLAFFYFTNDTVYFRNKNPDSDSFRAFINELVTQINKSKTASNKNNSQLLASELQQLRRLKDETVITEDVYEKAKALIFKHDAFRTAN